MFNAFSMIQVGYITMDAVVRPCMWALHCAVSMDAVVRPCMLGLIALCSVHGCCGEALHVGPNCTVQCPWMLW